MATTVAYGLQAIDMVRVNFKDLNLLEDESRKGPGMGFRGKQIIHPAQIAVVQQAFTAGAEEMAHELEVVKRSQILQAEGRGAFAMGENMVEAPMAKQAENLLARARAAGVLSQT